MSFNVSIFNAVQSKPLTWLTGFMIVIITDSRIHAFRPPLLTAFMQSVHLVWSCLCKLQKCDSVYELHTRDLIDYAFHTLDVILFMYSAHLIKFCSRSLYIYLDLSLLMNLLHLIWSHYFILDAFFSSPPALCSFGLISLSIFIFLFNWLYVTHLRYSLCVCTFMCVYTILLDYYLFIPRFVFAFLCYDTPLSSCAMCQLSCQKSEICQLSPWFIVCAWTVKKDPEEKLIVCTGLKKDYSAPQRRDKVCQNQMMNPE